MRALIHTAPLHISDHVEQEMALTGTETRHLLAKNRNHAKGALPPQNIVRIGLFFDGTNNNLERDTPRQSHTNVVKLFNAHKDVNGLDQLKAPGHYHFYIPGLGTRFEANREWRETQDGKAFGKGGQARILYALLEVYNAVYREFNDNKPLFSSDEITAKLQQYVREIEHDDPLRDTHAPRPNRRSWFAAINAIFDSALQRLRTQHPPPTMPHVSVAVFGFSRGAALARAFCYWFDDVLAKNGTFGGMPASIDFLGVFETVASVGMGQSSAETTPLFFTDGHWNWASEILLPLPACVKETVHFIAAHEQRRNFPLTRTKAGKGTGKVTEVLYPGVHSDIGGGYQPGDQGRAMLNARGEMAMLLSQIPLAHMHRAASAAGVPLAAYSAMPARLQKDYEIHPALALAWNDYMAAGDFAGVSGDKVAAEVATDYHAIVRKHMALYYGYRRQHLAGLEGCTGFSNANAQEREDMHSYNALLQGDLAVLEQRAAIAIQDASTTHDGLPGPRRRAIGFQNETHTGANAWQLWLARNGVAPGPDELWALKEMRKPCLAGNTPFFALLDGYMHDSLAGFTLAGFGTDEEKAEALLTMAQDYDKTGKAPSTPYKKQVWENYQNAIITNPALAQMVQNRIAAFKQAAQAPDHPGATTAHADKHPFYRADREKAMENTHRNTAFAPAEQTILSQFFPLQTDAYVAELRHFAIKTQTLSRREGSGYLRQRHVFE